MNVCVYICFLFWCQQLEMYSMTTHIHTHTHCGATSLWGPILDIMHSLAPYLNLTHLKTMSNHNPYLYLILSLTLNSSLNPQTAI